MATLLSDSASSDPASRVTITATTGTNVGFGQLLRTAREHHGLTVQQIARETKIAPRHLESLERGDLPEAGERFYRRAQIRTFARAVHCDEHLALTLFDQAALSAATKPAPPAVERIREPLFSQPRLAATAAVLLLAAILGRLVGSPGSFVRDASPAKPSVATAVPPAAAADRSVELVSPAQSVQQAPAPIELTPTRPSVAAADAPVPAETGATAVPTSGTTPAATTSFTELVVTSEPAGARVTVNGVGWGVAPVTIRYLSPGQKRVRVTMDGFATEDRVVNLVEGSSKALGLRLTQR